MYIILGRLIGRLVCHNFLKAQGSYNAPIGALIWHNFKDNLFPCQELEYALKLFNYFFTAIFILEAAIKISALGVKRYLTDRSVMPMRFSCRPA